MLNTEKGCMQGRKEEKKTFPVCNLIASRENVVWALWTSAEGNVKTRCPDKRRTNENNLNGRFIITERLCLSVLIGRIVAGKTDFFPASDNMSDQKL